MTGMTRLRKPMKTAPLISIVFTLLIAPAWLHSADPAPPVPSAPLGQTGKWAPKPAFSDEFDSDTVDPRKWNDSPSSWGPWTWDKNNAFLKDGKLVLRMVHEPHTRKNTQPLFYKSGIIRSKLQRTYGYYEARIKGCSLFPGACPAFWLYSDGKQTTGEVRYCEIDFVELQMNELNHATKERAPVNLIEMNLHLRLADKDGTVRWVRPKMDPELCANSWMAPWDPREDFHVYGCDVTPETIVWYIDGNEVARKSEPILASTHEPHSFSRTAASAHRLGWSRDEACSPSRYRGRLSHDHGGGLCPGVGTEVTGLPPSTASLL